MKRYSIIVPNRNHPELLRRALDSVPSREDVEIIVVDDASDPSLIDRQAYPGLERDDCHVVFTSEGKGAGYARNVGLDHASGEWLVFLDSDDLFADGFLSLLDNHCEVDDDIIYFGCKSVDSETLLPSYRLEYRSELLERYAGRPELIEFHNRYMHTEPWGKMIRRDFILRERIRFEETVCANDYLFSVVSGHKARKVSYDPSVLYCLTSRDDSLSKQFFNTPRKVWDRMLVYWHVQQFFRKENVPLYPFYEFWEQYTRESPEVARMAEPFRKDQHISRCTLALGILRFKFRKRFHIGVPYCR